MTIITYHIFQLKQQKFACNHINDNIILYYQL